MQICQDHWTALRQAIDEKGLSHLVAKSGEEAVHALRQQLAGDQAPAHFDPLMNANWAIFAAFMEDAGPEALGFDGCPLCVVEQHQEGLAAEWIDGASGDQLDAARQMQLVPEVQ
ncbi:MAG: hypothetical protein KDJ90_12685 [Nitratireductor sp.]|nr:hypothetical protein [Nitratireductor sp.]